VKYARGQTVWLEHQIALYRRQWQERERQEGSCDQGYDEGHSQPHRIDIPLARWNVVDRQRDPESHADGADLVEIPVKAGREPCPVLTDEQERGDGPITRRRRFRYDAEATRDMAGSSIRPARTSDATC
jgi:hypothetical protein